MALSMPYSWLLLAFLLSTPYCHCLDLLIDQVQNRLVTSCNITVQGRHLRADDRGRVCMIMEVNPASGCCPADTEQYPCRGCSMDSQCCNVYEYCVACCLNPMQTPDDIVLKTNVAKQITGGTSNSVFDYCRGRCRHNSESVVHENAYASEDHHCFSRLDNSAEEGPEREDVEFEDLTIVIGRQGQSCDAACKGRGKICKLNALPELNKCSKLKKYLNCKEACIATTGEEYPAEVVSTAPRHMHPGACMYSTGKPAFSCQGFHPYSRRLCPCVE